MSLDIHNFCVLLASTSPQRKKILSEMGIAHKSVATNDNEVSLPDAAETVLQNARIKVTDAFRAYRDYPVILGADTILAVGNRTLGKPNSAENAQQYLSDLGGRKVSAYSGVAAVSCETGKGIVCVERAEIILSNISPKAGEWYVGTGEPITRAGALGITLLGEIFVEQVMGAYSCVAGLPKRATLLVLSDYEALGKARLNLDGALASTLKGPWVVNIDRFEIQ